SSVTFSYTRFPVAIDAINPNGTLKWRKEYPDGSFGGIGIIQGPGGNIFTIIDNIGLVSIDRNNGSQVCNSNNTIFSGILVGGSDGVFSSRYSVVSSYGANCTSGSIFQQQERDIELKHYQDGIIYAFDYPLYPYDSNQTRLLALSKEGNLLWRASDILPVGTPVRAIKNNVLYMLGNHVTDSNKQKLFLLNASTGEMLNSLETSPYCSSCGVAVANDGTIYLNDLSSTKIYKIAASQPPNQTPTAGFTMTSGTQSATEGKTLTVSAPTSPVFINFSAARSSDADGTVTAWEWKIDGNVVSTASSFAYGLNHGNHTVSLTVTDNQGGVSQAAVGQINIQLPPPCTVTDSIPADKDTLLIKDGNDSKPIGDRIPLIFIHGIHGNRWSNGAYKGIDDISKPNRQKFEPFLKHFNKDEFELKYKIYRFHYVSDKYSVSQIARALRNDLDSEICDDAKFDKPFVIVAHSMGGLVARSYMNQYPHNVGNFAPFSAGKRVVRLITLGTPHHGSPGTNSQSRDERTTFGWEPAMDIASVFYWKTDEFLKIPISRVPYNAPNRWDLLW
ncbi:MAG: hypothetical protein LC778_21365, partial [Acidobacteria bacterium]|nr:hypothetical protein [Acidobacteriota bacterium]